MDTFFTLFNPRVLNAFAAVGLVFLHFTFVKLFQRSDPDRSKFFWYLALGWIGNLFYLMFLDLLPRLSIDPSFPKVIIRSLNTITFLSFLLASRWQIPQILKHKLTNISIIFAVVSIILSWLSIPLGRLTATLYTPGVALAPLAVAAVGFNYQQHFHLTRESLPAGTKFILVFSIYMYALLQCALFALPPFSGHMSMVIPHFEDLLHVVGALLKLGNIFGLALYSQAVFADYQAKTRFIDRAKLCVNLSEQLSHEIQTPATELRVRIENAIQSQGSLSGAELAATKRLVNDISTLIEVFETYQSDQRFDQAQAHVSENCNLNTICDEVIFSIKATMHPKCRFERVYESKPIVFALKTEISQIVRNLVKNSVEAIGRRATRTGVPSVILQTESSPDQDIAHLWVRDNGPGIDSVIFPRIFEDGITTNRGRGRGHGLFISRALAEKNKGLLEAANLYKNGIVNGAEFHLKLPLAK